MKKNSLNPKVVSAIKLFLLVVVTGGVIPMCFCGNIGVDLYLNGFVMYDESAFIKFATLGLLLTFVIVVFFFRLSVAPRQPDHDFKIETDVKGRCNLPTHLRCKKI